jgi:hypothetical protein
MDLDKGESLEDTESESDDDDPQKPWKVLTKLNKPNKQNLKKAVNERINSKRVAAKTNHGFGVLEGFKKAKTGRKKGRHRQGARSKGRGR